MAWFGPVLSTAVRRSSRLAALPLLAGLAACGGGERMPEGQLARASLAVERANTTRAGEFAAAELNRAQQGLAAARSSAAAEDYTQARRLAENAELDATLAEARTAATVSRRDLERLRAAPAAGSSASSPSAPLQQTTAPTS